MIRVRIEELSMELAKERYPVQIRVDETEMREKEVLKEKATLLLEQHVESIDLKKVMAAINGFTLAGTRNTTRKRG